MGTDSGDVRSVIATAARAMVDATRDAEQCPSTSIPEREVDWSWIDLTPKRRY